jgi:hypothetical protein
MWNKYVCKKDRKDRYEITSNQLSRFDERRLIDARFWLFIGSISNAVFQLNVAIKPLPNTNQLEVNYIYWVMTIVIWACLIISWYGNMKAVGYGLAIFTIRNILPLFDPEDRAKAMSEGERRFLVLFQGMATMINLMLINNIFDNTLLFEVIMSGSMFLGVLLV